MHRPELRSVPRFFLNTPLQAFSGGRAIRVVDLSAKGARLEHLEALTPGTDINLAVMASDREVSVKATVLWCEIDSLQLKTAHDRYLTGITFRSSTLGVEELLDELIHAKAVTKIEDFRNFDRYRISAPLTASFGAFSPVSVLDLSMRGAKVESGPGMEVGSTGQLIFQVDAESGPIDAMGKVMWTVPTVDGGFHTGLQVEGADEAMADAIHRLCRRGEAHIDLDALRRKFDTLRTESLRGQAQAGAA